MVVCVGDMLIHRQQKSVATKIGVENVVEVSLKVDTLIMLLYPSTSPLRRSLEVAMLDLRKMETRRKALGLSQEEAAVRAGLATRQQWNAIVKGHKANITMETLDRIAEALQCDSRELVMHR